jgi:hypothetical protein
LSSLPGDGAWRVDLTSDELAAAGWPAGVTAPGSYTWTFLGGRARIDLRESAGNHYFCDANLQPIHGGFRLTYDQAVCGGEIDDISWVLDEHGLRLSLITTNAALDQQKAYLETKVWEAIPLETAPRPFASEPPWLSRCELGCQGPIAAGTFTSEDFDPGLELTFSDSSWFNTADYHDEIEFDSPVSALRFWQTAGASSATGDLLANVPRTAEGLTDWFVGNPDMVVSKPENVKIGDGIVAKTFTFDVSEANVNDDPECPVRSCLNVLWINEGHVFGIGIDSGERLYLFDVGAGTDARTIVASLDTHVSTLPSQTVAVDRILETLHMP